MQGPAIGRPARRAIPRLSTQAVACQEFRASSRGWTMHRRRWPNRARSHPLAENPLAVAGPPKHRVLPTRYRRSVRSLPAGGGNRRDSVTCKVVIPTHGLDPARYTARSVYFSW